VEHIRANRAYFAFLGWITLLAIPLALLTVLYLAGLRVGSDFVRTVLPSQWLPGVDPRLLTIGVATAAGLLVGLILRYLGGSDSRALSDELVEEGKVAYRNLPGMILAALVGLSSGASLGPEGPLAHLGGGLGTWLAERRRFDRDRSRVLSLSGIAAVFGGFLTQPLGGAFLAFEFTKLVTFPFYIYLIPAIVASLAGYLVYFAITGASLVGLYQFDEITTLKVTDFLYVFVLSLMGVGVGILFKLIFRTVQRLTRPLQAYPVLRPAAGGLLFGLIGAAMPLTLYSGEHELAHLIEHPGEYSALYLLLLGAAKLVTLSICMSTGFPGGFIFPLLFAAGSFGVAAHALLPAVPLSVAVVGAMSGIGGAVMRMPIATIILVGILAGPEYMPLIILGAIVGYLVAQISRGEDARDAYATAETEGVIARN